MIAFYSDPHIGLNRLAHTTPASRKLWRTRILENCTTSSFNGSVYCGGDFFDKYHNSEETIRSALPVFHRTHHILAGNHDVTNAKDRIGSLELMNEVFPKGRILLTEYGEYGFELIREDQTDIYMIPHVANQELFEKSLLGAILHAGGNERLKVLMLHCNYNLGFKNTTDTTLNLTEERAKDLLACFHFVLLGHEHVPASYFDDRLIIMGSVFPTAFDNISSKYFYTLMDGTNVINKLPIYLPEIVQQPHPSFPGVIVKACQETLITVVDSATDLPSAGVQKTEKQLNFVEYGGSLLQKEFPGFMQGLKAMWVDNPLLLGVRVNVEVLGQISATTGRVSLDSLPELISTELTGQPIESLWKEFNDSDNLPDC